MEDQGYRIRDIQEHIQRRIEESYSDRFAHVTISKQNGEWVAKVQIEDSFIPHDKLDGMVIS